MLKKIKNIGSLFCENPDFNLVENLQEFTLGYTCSQLIIPSLDDFNEACKQVASVNDRIEIFISIDNQEPVSYYVSDNEKRQDFIIDVEVVQAQYEEGSNFTVQISIYKEVRDSVLKVYSYSAFLSFLLNKSLTEILHTFQIAICTKNIKTFLFLDCQINIITESFRLISSKDIEHSNFDDTVPRDELIEQRSEICSFNQSSIFQLVPNDFNIVSSEGEKKEIEKLISRLCVILSFSFLADLSEFQNSDSYFFKINGYKTLNGKLSLNEVSIVHVQDTVKIFKWVYSKGGTSDKIGLTRNLLSLTLDTKNLEIDESTYSSILSNYEIYLQKNVESYIQIKGKISDFLDNADKRTNAIVDNFGKTFRNSIVAFISYFFTVIIIRYVNSEDLSTLFTDEIAYLSFAFLGATFILLILTIWDALDEKRRLINLYNKTKDRYKYLLDKNDLKRIFSNDKEHENDIEYINKKMRVYTIVWGLIIIFFFFIVYCLSELHFLGCKC